MKLEGTQLPLHSHIIWAYGGASNAMPDNTKQGAAIAPKDCYQNVFSMEGNAFTLYYGNSRKLKILEALTPPGDALRLGDANQQEQPLLLLHSGKNNKAQLVTSTFPMQDSEAYYFCFYYLSPTADYTYFMLPKLFKEGSYRVNQETEWMKSTPD